MKKFLLEEFKNSISKNCLQKIGIGFLMLFCCLNNAQAQQSFLLLQLDSKLPNNFSITRPSEFLSPQSIQRRAEHNVAFNAQRDLPVKTDYISQIRATGVTIRGISKWMNAVLVRGNASQINAASTLPFVQNTRALTINSLNFSSPTEARCKLNNINDVDPSQNSLWEPAYRAVRIDSNISFLSNPATDTCIIAVFDSGFWGVTTNGAFRNLRNSRRIIHTENMVDDNRIDVTADDDHGTNCLSILAGSSTASVNGAAQAAKFALFRTEEVMQETELEPFYWLLAAEKADSLGADLISSSLGYYDFDNPALNYPFSSLNGNTTLISRAANTASELGMWIFNSAGNEGNDISWNRAIVAPCDADSVTCVGAINSSLNFANFSSRGPNANGRIKPELVGFGVNVAVVGRNIAGVNFGSGTSFSTPFVAAIAKLVWDYNKERANFPNWILKRLMYASADSVGNITPTTQFPNNEVGFGLPNWQKFKRNYAALQATLVNSAPRKKIEVLLYPNPVSSGNELRVTFSTPFSAVKINIFDVQGIKKASYIQEAEGQEVQLPTYNLMSGIYLLEYEVDGKAIGREKLLVK